MYDMIIELISSFNAVRIQDTNHSQFRQGARRE